MKRLYLGNTVRIPKRRVIGDNRKNGRHRRETWTV